MGERTDGDRLFEDYLGHVGVRVPEHEPDLGIGVRIEYLLDIDGHTCATEVKEFAPESWPLKRRIGSYSFKTLLKPIRKQIYEAAHKLHKAERLGHPLVVILTDPHRAMSAFLGPEWIVWAMMGDPEGRVPVSEEAQPAGPARIAAGRHGKLRTDHAYISAVTVINDEAEHPRARTFITNSPDAVPLSPAFFRGADDLVWEYSDEDSAYVPVDGPQNPSSG
jgi:hypothetical protein